MAVCPPTGTESQPAKVGAITTTEASISPRVGFGGSGCSRTFSSVSRIAPSTRKLCREAATPITVSPDGRCCRCPAVSGEREGRIAGLKAGPFMGCPEPACSPKRRL